jgi:hypothetical protein
VGEAFFAVEAEGFEAAVAEHFYYLGVFYGEGVSIVVRDKRKGEGKRAVRWVVGRGLGVCTLAFFFEGKFALFIIVLILSSTPVFTTLRIVSAISAF